MAVGDAIEVVTVASRADRRRFLAQGDRLARDQRRRLFDPAAGLRLFVAVQRGRPVARVAADIERGRFGLLAAAGAVAAVAVLAAAERVLARHGRTRIRGPYGLSVLAQDGLAVSGPYVPPTLVMGVDPDWLGAVLEVHGYRPDGDVRSYLLALPRPGNVMPGLDPGIHVVPQVRAPEIWHHVGGRVKPGHDGDASADAAAGLATAFADLAARGCRQVELTGIPDDSAALRALADAVGGVPYRTWRLFAKELG
ncbi:MAG: hypothetical protein HY985_17015 [Magnetospirillum sp.]|nr:hypothetical protein [Magnetospirillum sp.]